MKLHQILEDRNIKHETVDVHFKHEVETEDEFQQIPMIAHVKVTIVPDKYDMKDSPTGYDADLVSITNEKTGKTEDLKSLKLSQKTIDSILDKAVDKVED